MSDDVITTAPAQPGTTTIIERSGGGSTGVSLIVLLVLLAALGLGAFYLIDQSNKSNKAKDDAISSAAQSVKKTADKAGDAIDKATK